MTDDTDLPDWEDDDAWDALLTTADTVALEAVSAEVIDAWDDHQQQRLDRKAEFETWCIEDREPRDYRAEVARFAQDRADAYALNRLIQDRRRQLTAALKDQVGIDDSTSARTLIYRLANAIRMHQDGTLAAEEMHGILDRTFLVASHRRQSIREFIENGAKW